MIVWYGGHGTDIRGFTILLLEEGRILERATHDALMEQRGLDHDMVLRQMKANADAPLPGG